MHRFLPLLILPALLASCRAQDASPLASPVPTPTSTRPAATSSGQPAEPHGTLRPGATVVAQPLHHVVDVWRRPGPGARLQEQLWTGNGFHQRIRYPVISRFRDAGGEVWLQVQLPERPNGSTGWFRRRDVSIATVHDRILVDLSARRLVRFRGAEPVFHAPVGIGAAGYPTTTGGFFVWAKVDYPDDRGPYGAFALGLSGFSRVITDWIGGGRLAIHGTTDPDDRGEAISHGCVRVFNPDLMALADVPMGTPVRIRP